MPRIPDRDFNLTDTELPVKVSAVVYSGGDTGTWSDELEVVG
jgi:hypothetical protein